MCTVQCYIEAHELWWVSSKKREWSTGLWSKNLYRKCLDWFLYLICAFVRVENKEPATGLNISWIKKTYEIMQNCGDSSEILNKQISQRPCTFEFDSYFYFFFGLIAKLILHNGFQHEYLCHSSMSTRVTIWTNCFYHQPIHWKLPPLKDW